MAALNGQVLHRGGYAYTKSWPSTFATPQVAVDMALRAKLAGLFIKAADGNALVSANGAVHWWEDFAALAPVAAGAGLDVIPWLCVYPDDGPGSAFLANLANAVKLTGSKFVLLEPPMSQWAGATKPTTTAEGVIAAIQAAVPGVRFVYSTWGDPAAAAGFPFSPFNAATGAALPELYWSAYSALGTPGAVWNRYWLWLEAQPTVPGSVIPTFDFPKAAEFAALAHTEAAPTIAWWLLDDMTPAYADVLAGLPYAVTVTPTAQPAPQAPTDPQTPDLAAARTALSQAAAAIQAAQKALGG